MDELDQAVRYIDAAIERLAAEAEAYYAAGDNRRGNIRADTAERLRHESMNLTRRYDNLRALLAS